MSISLHVDSWSSCVKCEIGAFAHRHVFYRGKVPCKVLFVGEAPGVTEDLTGRPFVGKAGKRMDFWLTGFTDYALTNLVACRPCPHRGGPNRAPMAVEIANCSPRLHQFYKLANPRVIVAVGKFAKESIRHDIAIVHPAAYLYGPRDDEPEQIEKINAAFKLAEVPATESGG